jgi:hypothetical protein
MDVPRRTCASPGSTRVPCEYSTVRSYQLHGTCGYFSYKTSDVGLAGVDMCGCRVSAIFMSRHSLVRRAVPGRVPRDK